MTIVKKVILFCTAFYFLSCACVYADEVSIRDEISQLKERIQQLENKLTKQQNSAKEQISLADGLEIGASGTMIIQGTNNTNNAASDAAKKECRTDASYSADIAIGKEIKQAGSSLFLHLEAGRGAGLEDNLTLYSNVNRDADNDNNLRLTELWYEQALFKDKAALTFGKLDPTAYFDNNEIANDETTQFLSRIFRNSAVIEFPDNTAGIHLAYIPLEQFEFGYGVFDANSDWERIGDNLFNIGQITFKSRLFGLSGNYRFLGWHNNLRHTKWLAPEKSKESAYGFGLSFDQELTEIATIFCRYGWQNPKVYNPDITATGGLNYSLEHSWSTGIQIEGRPWLREKDVLGLAIGQIFPSDDYKNADAARRAKTEGHLETYYRIFINEHLSVSPDFQYIWNPFGKDVTEDTDSIFAAGIRTQVDF